MKKLVAAKTDEMPKVDLKEKHLANTKLLPDRMHLLDLMPKEGVVAELGVDQGGFSKQIMDRTKAKKLHLVDFWGSKRYNQNKRQGVENLFSKELESKQVEINIGYSTKVGAEFPENYFDWIYIDTDHSYQTTKDELHTYAPKMKAGGIIAGHDYIIANWNGIVKYGVIEAVHEFCLEKDWEIIYITTEQSNNPSFAIRKM